MQEIWNKIVSWFTSGAFLSIVAKIIIAILIMLISFKIINVVGKRILKKGEKRHADKTILRTLVYAIKLVLKILIALCMVGFLGIDTTGITALITSLGVCVGLAVNGALSNLAGGVLLIFTRPFRVDDYIEAQGYSGTVSEIRITTTKIITPDNKVIYIPNGALANGNIVNYSENDTRRVDLTFGISYDADAKKAVEIVKDLCLKHELVIKEKEPFVRIGEYADSSINISAKVWAKKEDYWTVNFDLLEQVNNAFKQNGIEIPYNQLDVHIKKD